MTFLATTGEALQVRDPFSALRGGFVPSTVILGPLPFPTLHLPELLSAVPGLILVLDHVDLPQNVLLPTNVEKLVLKNTPVAVEHTLSILTVPPMTHLVIRLDIPGDDLLNRVVNILRSLPFNLVLRLREAKSVYLFNDDNFGIGLTSQDGDRPGPIRSTTIQLVPADFLRGRAYEASALEVHALIINLGGFVSANLRQLVIKDLPLLHVTRKTWRNLFQGVPDLAELTIDDWKLNPRAFFQALGDVAPDGNSHVPELQTLRVLAHYTPEAEQALTRTLRARYDCSAIPHIALSFTYDSYDRSVANRFGAYLFAKLEPLTGSVLALCDAWPDHPCYLAQRRNIFMSA